MRSGMAFAAASEGIDPAVARPSAPGTPAASSQHDDRSDHANAEPPAEEPKPPESVTSSKREDFTPGLSGFTYHDPI